jgi:hypothetical protein
MKMATVRNTAGRATGRPEEARLPSGEWTPYSAAEGQT